MVGVAAVAIASGIFAQDQSRPVQRARQDQMTTEIVELATAAEENVNVKVVLLNNSALGLVHQQQTLFYGQRIFASKFKGVPDFLAVAKGFGWMTVDLDAEADRQAALARAMACKGPTFIHARIAMQEHVLPMVAPGAANREMIGG